MTVGENRAILTNIIHFSRRLTPSKPGRLAPSHVVRYIAWSKFNAHRWSVLNARQHSIEQIEDSLGSSTNSANSVWRIGAATGTDHIDHGYMLRRAWCMKRESPE